jgi:signal transduction histidine kinase
MKRATGLFWRVFGGVLATSLGTVLVAGLITRNALMRAFDSYLAARANMGMGRGMGVHILGAAEQTFIATVDRSSLAGALIALVAAVIAAFLIARSVARPIRELEVAAQALGAGDRSRRVQARGPAEIAALSTAFNSMADSLAGAEELRKRLVADIAHELRNPIAAARAQSEAMAEGVLPTDRARLESVVEDMTHLSALVDDLQELALADAGELRYELAPLDLALLVTEEAARSAALAPEGVEVRVAVPEDPLEVTGDARRLSQVLRNLIGNALRHTKAGSVTAELDATDDAVEVRVVDTGEGIPDADLPYVFERFYRADSSRAAATGGAGLGLAIARRIVEDHGGEVFARPTPGGGATVGFRLPVATAARS